MSAVFSVAVVAVLITMVLAMTRATRGPSTYDRILALNMFGTQTVLLIAITGFLFERPEWLDLALVYGLCNFIGTLAVLRFSKYGSFTVEEPAAAPSNTDAHATEPTEPGA